MLVDKRKQGADASRLHVYVRIIWTTDTPPNGCSMYSVLRTWCVPQVHGTWYMVRKLKLVLMVDVTYMVHVT